MKTAKQNRWKPALKVLVIVGLLNLILVIGIGAATAPSSATKAVVQAEIDASLSFIKTGEYSTDSDTELSKLYQTDAGKYVSIAELIGGILATIVNLIAIFIGYRYIRRSITSGSVEDVTTTSLTLGQIIPSMLLTPLVMIAFGYNNVIATTYGHWSYLVSLFFTTLLTFIIVGLIVHLLEIRHRKNHSFAIE